MKIAIMGLVLLVACAGMVFILVMHQNYWGGTNGNYVTGTSESAAVSNGEIILALMHSNGAAAAPEKSDYVDVRMQVPSGNIEVLYDAIDAAGKPHGDEAVVVIRADAKDLYVSVLPLILAAARGGAAQLRLEAGRTGVNIILPAAGGSVVAAGLITDPCEITVLSGEQAGQFMMENSKFENAEGLYEALAALSKEYRADSLRVRVKVQSKALWGDFVDACKAAVDAGLPVLLSGGVHDESEKSTGGTVREPVRSCRTNEKFQPIILPLFFV